MVLDKFVHDVKIFFDSIRNIGTCSALTLGLPFLEKAMPIICDSYMLKVIAVSFSISIIFALYLFNLIWLFNSLESEVKSKVFNAFGSLVIILLITIAIGGTAFVEVWSKLFNYV